MALVYKHMDENYIVCRDENYQEGDEQTFIPKVAGNRHYDEIMKQVAAGDLTIADAD